jgi:hypothetical protein
VTVNPSVSSTQNSTTLATRDKTHWEKQQLNEAQQRQQQSQEWLEHFVR